MFDLAIANLTSLPVLAFAFGLLATVIKGDLRLPDAVYQGISFYLLLGIGIKGGVALSEASAEEIIAPLAVTVLLGILTPVLAFYILRLMTGLGAVDRGAIAAHYGSTSLVTFTAALVFLESSKQFVEGYVATLLTVLEIPGIIVGLMLASGGLGRKISWRESLAEVLASKSVLLLVGGLTMGFITGASGYDSVEPFFGGLFTGALTLFLLELGLVAGRRMKDISKAGVGLVSFALLFPLVSGTLGVVGGLGSGLGVGGATVLGVLCASASYIAAPAAVRLALPEASPGLYLTASLGITFPFNLIFGIPIYYAIAQALGGI